MQFSGFVISGFSNFRVFKLKIQELTLYWGLKREGRRQDAGPRDVGPRGHRVVRDALEGPLGDHGLRDARRRGGIPERGDEGGSPRGDCTRALGGTDGAGTFPVASAWDGIPGQDDHQGPRDAQETVNLGAPQGGNLPLGGNCPAAPHPTEDLRHLLPGEELLPF